MGGIRRVSEPELPSDSMKWFVIPALSIVALALAAELLLQGAALFVWDRSSLAQEGTDTILCVGDSHTFGADMQPEESYPGRLQEDLDAVAPRHFSVVNLGIPGYNTTQVLKRLPARARRHQPAMVLVWAGVNDAWNLTGVATENYPWWIRLDGYATRSRLYRLVRVRLHDRRIEMGLDAPGSRAVLVQSVDELAANLDEPREFHVDGEIEMIEVHRREFQVDDEMIERATRNYISMAAWAKSAGVALALITYPVEFGGFAAANQAMRAAAAETGVPIVESGYSIARLSPKKRKLGWAGHPNAWMYREIASDVADLVLTTLPPSRRGASSRSPRRTRPR
jgi:lysophospholipase L1-like esterase